MRAAALFAAITQENDVREAWLGLATARRRLGDAAGAAEALAGALRRHVPDPAVAALADAIAREAGAPGWCGLASDGTLIVRAVPPATARQRRDWRGPVVTAADGRHFLGSPIDEAAIAATAGCVTSREGGLAGWAWHPGDPDRDPLLTIRPAKGSGRIDCVATEIDVQIDHSGLLGRPRGFFVPSADLAGLGGLLHVRGRDGRDLLGSPLDPRAEQVAAAAAAATLAALYPAAVTRPPRLAPPAAMPVAAHVATRPATTSRSSPPVDVVVPVHGGIGHTLACLESVLADLPRSSRLVVVDDASPDPELVAALDGLARRRRIRLVRNARNLGFAASANIGIGFAAGRDVVLLNSDTLVPPGWLQAMRAVAYAAPDIGTVTPLSNDATILSYPDPGGGNDTPDLDQTIRLDAMARLQNGGLSVEIPVGVGFCLYVRRACLDSVGLFRADLFAQGYGEENDFCLRARHLGWRHVAAPGVFVAHVGSGSFGAAARHLKARNAALLERLHPGYEALVEAFARADPLAEARHRLDLARWQAGRRRGGRAIVLVTHGSGGGVERQIAASVDRHGDAGLRAVVLRPSRRPDGTRCVTVGDGTGRGFPNLRFAMPDELPMLRRLLARERPVAVEVHHLVGHHPAVAGLATGLGVPYDVHVHDYAWLCGRVALVGPTQRYCGEPAVTACEACVADAGGLIDETITVAALRQRSAALLAGARRVVVPSEDTAARLQRHFPAIRPTVQPHEADAEIGDPPPPPPPSPTSACRICIVGAIGVHKGYQVVLDCARDAAERRLPMEFVVVGHTIDDRRLLATGRVFITGSYDADEVVTLIKAQNATYGMLPSIFPETWCLSLAEAWRAGLRVAVFDIGAQAERVRRTGRGVLLPLGLPAHAINNALIAAAGLSRHE